MVRDKIKILLVDGLQDMLSSETQMVKGLANLIKASHSPELKEAFTLHLKETEGHVERLKKIFSLLQIEPKSHTCQVMKGLIEECDEAIKGFPSSALRDAALIAKAQCIEHCEIAGYNTLKSFAIELEYKEVEALIKKTLEEEIATEKKLTKIAEGSLLTAGINSAANES